MTTTLDRPRPGTDIAIAIVLFAVGAIVAYTAMGAYRAAGIQPAFYQGNFEPAVMMACGHGFHTTTFQAIPPSLRAFLDLKSNTFSCADLPAAVPLVTVTWNGTWYYLYAATALTWKIAGVSWTALDGLVAVLAGLTSAALYALFRIVSGRALSAAGALLLTMSPANLTSVLSLRDYSKAPFVLGALWILALLLVRERSNRAVYVLAAAFGAVVGLGYGFRGDLLVMAPFGPAVMALLVPGPAGGRLLRNVTAAAIAAATFLIVGAPPLFGLRNAGGCQFHYALLGRTAPLVHEAAVEPALYSVGDQFTDTFVDLKVGDYANRALQRPAPLLCAPEYDEVSGALFRRVAMTFPADLVAQAYGAVLTITRSGFEIPDMPYPLPSWLDFRLTHRAYAIAQAITHVTSPAGPLLTAAAFALAWTASLQLGLALTVTVLFLGGYPAIEFESRHWFHLRFIPWWSAAAVVTVLWQRRQEPWRPIARGAVGVAATVVALVAALATVRMIQTRTVIAMLERYHAAATSPMRITRSGGSVAVDWVPSDFGTPPEHRSSDLVVATIDPARCGASGISSIRVAYETDNAAHDLTTVIPLAAPASSPGATHLFVPVFANGSGDRTYMRFRGFDAVGAATADCVTSVARVSDRDAIPLWIQVQAPADWKARGWYQSLRVPRALRWMGARTAS